jgi:hypothetical protein
MALMLSKTYDALLAAGAPEDKACGAAEEIAAHENRLTRIETDIALSAMLAQTFAILGGVAGLLKLLH